MMTLGFLLSGRRLFQVGGHVLQGHPQPHTPPGLGRVRVEDKVEQLPGVMLLAIYQNTVAVAAIRDK